MLPILYSYRRCPFAMRARMALKYAGIQVEHREISLRDKPQSMLLASPKGTVPVLCMDEHILDQSLDIMRWAIEKSDPDGWGNVDENAAQDWIAINDGSFKAYLDVYKYPNRYPDHNPEGALKGAIEVMLEPIETTLRSNPYLLGNKMSWVDVAIFPFIRQFSMVNAQNFEDMPFPHLKGWLNGHLESKLFCSVMDQYPIWTE